MKKQNSYKVLCKLFLELLNNNPISTLFYGIFMILDVTTKVAFGICVLLQVDIAKNFKFLRAGNFISILNIAIFGFSMI